MARHQLQKVKALAILDYLREYTDEEHGASVDDIISHLANKGISAERKSVYDDVETLNAYGADIVKSRDKNRTLYHLASRVFETAEVKMLVDIIEASRFVTPKKSEELIGKIETLCSTHDAKKLSRQVTIAGRVKAPNEIIYINVDKIHTAFVEDRCVSFRYFNYDWEKKKRYRDDVVSATPLSLVWNNDNYYLVAYNRDKDKQKHYRVDKMESVTLGDVLTDAEREMRANFDTAGLTRRVFDMFGGDPCRVELFVDESLVGVIFDRFGVDTVLRRDASGAGFITDVSVELSPSFYAWLATFAGAIRLVSPKSAVSAAKAHFVKVLESMEDKK